MLGLGQYEANGSGKLYIPLHYARQHSCNVMLKKGQADGLGTCKLCEAPAFTASETCSVLVGNTTAIGANVNLKLSSLASASYYREFGGWLTRLTGICVTRIIWIDSIDATGGQLLTKRRRSACCGERNDEECCKVRQEQHQDVIFCRLALASIAKFVSYGHPTPYASDSISNLAYWRQHGISE